MSVRTLKIAIIIMTFMIIVGIVLLFYGIATKSSRLVDTKLQDDGALIASLPGFSRDKSTGGEIEIELPDFCHAELFAVEADRLVFSVKQDRKPDGEQVPLVVCPLAVETGRVVGSRPLIYIPG